MITLTFGNSGTYATFGAVWAAMAAAGVSDNYTLMQVGDSIEAGSVTSAGNVPLFGKTVTLTSNVPHNGSELVGWICQFASCTLKVSGSGSFIVDNMFMRATNNTASAIQIGNPGGSVATGPTNETVLKNSLFRAGTTAGATLVVGANVFSANPDFATIKIVNCKFTGGIKALSVRPNSGGGSGAQGHTSVIIENCAFRTTAAGVGFALGVQNALQLIVYRNLTAIVFDSVNQAMIDDSWIALGQTYTSQQNATSPAKANLITGIVYTAITVPADILNTNPALANYLETSSGSTLYTAGAMPQLAENPYNVAPYPIGIPGPAPTPTSSPGLWMPAFVGGV